MHCILFKFKISTLFQISYPAIRNTYDEIRAKISKYVTILAGNEKLGGIEKIVEVDESVFSHIKLKSEKKSKRKKIWAVGFFERETENIRVFVVQSRKKEILHELI